MDRDQPTRIKVDPMKKIVSLALLALLCLGLPAPALAEYPAFDLESATVTLNNGVEMPILGIGTFALSSEEAENSVYWALRDGYRLIDTARIYGNEDGVGRGIRRAIDEGYDDVRNWVPQLKKANIAGNQPIVDLLKEYAAMKDATPAQISLAWMLHKYPNVVPIPGSKNKGRIVENLGASGVELTDEEFRALEASLNECKVYGHRGLGGF